MAVLQERPQLMLWMKTGRSPVCSKIADEYSNKKVENKEDFILVIESDQCSACTIYMPTMEKVVKNYNVKVNYINIRVLTDEQSAKLATYVYTNSTPLTVYFKEGVASDTHNRIVGAANYDAIVESFTKNGYIGK